MRFIISKIVKIIAKITLFTVACEKFPRIIYFSFFSFLEKYQGVTVELKVKAGTISFMGGEENMKQKLALIFEIIYANIIILLLLSTF